MVNATQKKFGYPGTLIARTDRWSIQLRPAQPTLGSLVIVCTEPVTAFGAASPAAFAELQGVIANVERILGEFVSYERINYLMLMMVDLDVHFHVIPRYEKPREFAGLDFPDSGWPGPPALSDAVSLPDAVLADLTTELRAHWPLGHGAL